MPIHNIPESEIVAPGRSTRQNLSRYFGQILTEYATCGQLSDSYREYLTIAPELLDEFSYVFGDREIIHKQPQHSFVRSLLHSDTLEFLTQSAALQAMPNIWTFSRKQKQEHIANYKALIIALLEGKDIDKTQAAELGRVFEKYSTSV